MVENNYNTFSKNLIYLMKEHGLTEVELSTALEVSEKSIQRWKLDKTFPKMATIEKIANTFNLDVNSLLTRDLEKENVKEGTEISLRLPKTLLKDLEEKAKQENITLEEYILYTLAKNI